MELFAAAVQNWSQAVDDNRHTDAVFYSREIDVALRLLLIDPACRESVEPILNEHAMTPDALRAAMLAVFKAAEARGRAPGAGATVRAGRPRTPADGS